MHRPAAMDRRARTGSGPVAGPAYLNPINAEDVGAMLRGRG